MDQADLCAGSGLKSPAHCAGIGAMDTTAITPHCTAAITCSPSVLLDAPRGCGAVLCASGVQAHGWQQAPTLVERAGCLARTAAPQPLGASRSKRRRRSSARARQGPTHDDKADEDGCHGPDSPVHPVGVSWGDENGGGERGKAGARCGRGGDDGVRRDCRQPAPACPRWGDHGSAWGRCEGARHALWQACWPPSPA